PDESIFQTVLVNNDSFKFYGQNIHYISWSKPNDGRPGIVSSAHLPQLARDDIFFARKFDVEKDPEILSVLDERIFAS
ncbi:MAG: N-acetylglucosaminyltransferase, partial [Cyanobacteria bacterium J06633_23]